MGYQAKEVTVMANILIRDVPDEVIASIDARAARLGLSRSEYIRRQWIQDAARGNGPVSVEDLATFAATFADLADPDVMSKAWE
jgi:plasmid stability protein